MGCHYRHLNFSMCSIPTCPHTQLQPGEALKPILTQLQEKADFLGASATPTTNISGPTACQILFKCDSPPSIPNKKRKAKDLYSPFPVCPPPPTMYSAHTLRH